MAITRGVLAGGTLLGVLLYMCRGWALTLLWLIWAVSVLLIGASGGLLLGSVWDGRQNGRIMPDWPSNLGLLLGCGIVVYCL